MVSEVVGPTATASGTHRSVRSKLETYPIAVSSSSSENAADRTLRVVAPRAGNPYVNMPVATNLGAEQCAGPEPAADCRDRDAEAQRSLVNSHNRHAGLPTLAR